MNVVICPGIHDPVLTHNFMVSLDDQWDYMVFPADHYPAYSAIHILDFLRRQLTNPLKGDRSLFSISHVPLIFVGFSAGVVGAIGAAWTWRLLGGTVRALIALDGWGVPLYGDFPIHRISHDYLTHWSSALLGAGDDSFYADPPISHLELWRSPQTASGYLVQSPAPILNGYAFPKYRISTTAAQFISTLLNRYGSPMINSVTN